VKRLLIVVQLNSLPGVDVLVIARWNVAHTGKAAGARESRLDPARNPEQTVLGQLSYFRRLQTLIGKFGQSLAKITDNSLCAAGKVRLIRSVRGSAETIIGHSSTGMGL
jgi:hypothetical protein